MKRFVLYAVMIILTFLVQNNVFACSPILEATPNLLLGLTFSLAFIRGQKEGLFIGFFCGLLMDTCYGEILGYYALIYMFIGYVNGMIGGLFYQEFLNMPLLLCVLSDFIYHLYIYVTGFLLHNRVNIPVYVSRIILPEVVYTAVLSLAIYKLILTLNAGFEEREKKNATRFT